MTGGERFAPGGVSPPGGRGGFPPTRQEFLREFLVVRGRVGGRIPRGLCLQRRNNVETESHFVIDVSALISDQTRRVHPGDEVPVRFRFFVAMHCFRLHVSQINWLWGTGKRLIVCIALRSNRALSRALSRALYGLFDETFPFSFSFSSNSRRGWLSATTTTTAATTLRFTSFRFLGIHSIFVCAVQFLSVSIKCINNVVHRNGLLPVVFHVYNCVSKNLLEP